jgi:hypothetical protein
MDLLSSFDSPEAQLNTSQPHAKDDPQFIDINVSAMPNLSLLFSVLTPQKQQFASAASYS